jgi:hypothetical protein
MATASDTNIYIMAKERIEGFIPGNEKSTHQKKTIQPSNRLPFALGFIITYWNPLQKEIHCCLVLVKKMGSLQKAVMDQPRAYKSWRPSRRKGLKRQCWRRHCWWIEGGPFPGFWSPKSLLAPTTLWKQMKRAQANGEFDVDFGKFFKKEAANLDVKIFEET